MDIRDAAGVAASKKFTVTDILNKDSKAVIEKFSFLGLRRPKPGIKRNEIKEKKQIKQKINIAKPVTGQKGGGLSGYGKTAIKSVLVVVAAGLGVVGAKKLARGLENQRRMDDAAAERLRQKVRSKIKDGQLRFTQKELKDAAEFVDSTGLYDDTINRIVNNSKKFERDKIGQETLFDYSGIKQPVKTTLRMKGRIKRGYKRVKSKIGLGGKR